MFGVNLPVFQRGLLVEVGALGARGDPTSGSLTMLASSCFVAALVAFGKPLSPLHARLKSSLKLLRRVGVLDGVTFADFCGVFVCDGTASESCPLPLAAGAEAVLFC